MKPKDAFDATMLRVDCLLDLFTLLRNTRSRGTRKDWASRFKSLMHWPQGETIHRIDGTGAVVILRQAAALGPDKFSHEALSDLLRSAVVTSVAALDKYCHDVLIHRLLPQTRRPVKQWCKDLERLSVPLSVVVAAVAHAKRDQGGGDSKRTRPMTIIRNGLQDQFHRRRTLQRPDDIAEALSMVGVKNLWGSCAKRMHAKAEYVKSRLDRIVARRNLIVHESDIVRFRRVRKVTMRRIALTQVADDVAWLRRLVRCIDGLCV